MLLGELRSDAQEIHWAEVGWIFRTIRDTRAPYPGEIYVTALAGSIVVINAVLWHGGTRNTSGARRRQLHLSFTRRDLPQQLNQRAYLTPGLFNRLSPALRYLMDVEA